LKLKVFKINRALLPGDEMYRRLRAKNSNFFTNFPPEFIQRFNEGALILTYLGLNTVLAYGSLSQAIKLTEATRVSVIITLNPIITFVTMAILTRLQVSWIGPENFSIFSIFGALSVLGGAVLVIYAGWKR